MTAISQPLNLDPSERYFYVYKATVDRVIDGDTVDLTLDLGLRIYHRLRVRLYGIDTPELNATDPAVRERAVRAKDALANILARGPLYVETIKDRLDKYGRWLAVLHVTEITTEAPINVNDAMVNLGHAQPYFPT